MPYAWDLAEIGMPSTLDRFCSLGLDTVTIAGSYHASKFLRLHGKTGKVYFPEDGVVYFALNGAYNCPYAVLPSMRDKQAGAIIYTGSVNALAALGDRHIAPPQPA
jgi:hypothetical protein